MKDIKSKHVTLMMLVFSMDPFIFLCALQVASWPPLGAASVTLCLMGCRRCTWRKPKLPRLPPCDAGKERWTVLFCSGQSERSDNRLWCVAKQNVVRKMRAASSWWTCNAAQLCGFTGGVSRLCQGGGVWSKASECDVFKGLLLCDYLICLPVHCLCQLPFKGISL